MDLFSLYSLLSEFSHDFFVQNFKVQDKDFILLNDMYVYIVELSFITSLEEPDHILQAVSEETEHRYVSFKYFKWRSQCFDFVIVHLCESHICFKQVWTHILIGLWVTV